MKTKQLEALHAAVYSTSCSSEDVSMGDRKLGRKNNFNLNDESSLNENSPVDILDHLQHIQEKLTRHWRVEEAVLKQIRDLEMQIAALKHTCSVRVLNACYFTCLLLLPSTLLKFVTHNC